jgi:mono/diheme cytochrome c family protein
MRKPLLIIGLLVVIVYACNQRGKTINSLLSTGKLPTQLFSIDISKDTTLITKNGALIRIPRGALSANGNTVQLEVKEAYSMQDIIKAGLTTQSNGQPLSSGGMIYINAVGENTVRITQKISIATPTPFIEKNMQLFKGETQGDSTINWINPKPLPENPQLTALDKGKVLFQDNCATCHAIGKNGTGPDLAHVMKRLIPSLYKGKFGLDHFYEFTRNPAKVMAHEVYYRCLKNKFGGAMMNAFPDLTNEDLDNLYAYIENESESRNLPVTDNGILKCLDSCQLYYEVASKWKEIKSRLEKDSNDLLDDVRSFPVSRNPPAELTISDTIEQPITFPEKVSPIENRSLYYQFTIESFGWYNLDMILENFPGFQPSKLMVRIQGQYKERLSIYLIIPSLKLMAPGGPLKNKPDTYGFYETDGTIPLPQHAQAYIITMGEYEDQIIFAKKEFSTQEKQEFDLQLTTITKEAFQQQIAAMQLSDVAFKISDTKNAAELRTAIKELKKAEDLKPKNCDCDCFLNDPHEAAGESGSDYSIIDITPIPNK